MKDSVYDSIIEITSKRDTDEFSIGIVTIVAKLIPNSVVCLFRHLEYPKTHFVNIVTLLAKVDDIGIHEYEWEVPIPDSTKLHICEEFNDFSKFSEYRTSDGCYHIFIPIKVDSKPYYALDICSKQNASEETQTLKTITNVCENFYTILSCSEKDSLTGLYNRRTYDQKLGKLLQRQYRKQKNNSEQDDNREQEKTRNSWLAVVDIDLFKRVNDKFGHIYGDEVLLILSQLMQQSFRHNDLLFRFGGEEFVLVFEPISKSKVIHVLDKFRKKIAQHNFPMVGNITVSIGYAKITESDHPKSVFDNADKALYFAKDNGRNQLQNFESLIEEGKIKGFTEEGDIELF